MPRPARIPVPYRWLVPFLVVCATAPASATDCLDWSELPEPAATLDTGGDIRAMARSADLVIAGVGTRVVIAGLGTANREGELDLGATVLDVSASGTLAAAALGHGGVALVDISDPAAPFLAGTVAGSVWAAGIDGDLLCAWTTPGLVTHDVSDPAAPVLLGSHSQGIGGDDIRVVVGDAKCFVSSRGGYATLRSYDLVDPAAPVVGGAILPVLGLMDVGRASAVAAAGDLLHLAVNHLGYDGSGEFLRDARLFTVDVSDLAAPVKVGEMLLGDAPAAGLDLAGTIAAVALPHQVQLVDVSDPSALSPLATHAAFGATGDALACNGARAACGLADLRIIDVAGPPVTPVLDRWGVGGQEAGPPMVAEDHVLIHVGNAGEPRPGGYDDYRTLVYDVSDPADPVYRRQLGGPHGTNAKALAGDHLYGDGIWNWRTGATVPAPTSGPERPATWVAGTTLYETGTGLRIWDISVPTAPVVAGEILPGVDVHDVVADGNLVGVVADMSLFVLDATDPLAPLVLATVYLSESFQRGALEDGRLVLIGPGGYRLFDLRQPTLPVPGGGATATDLVDVDLSGGIAYLASSSGGTQAVAVGQDATPIPLGRFVASERPLLGHAVVGPDVFAVHDGVFGFGSGEYAELIRLAPECMSTVPNLVASFAVSWRDGICHVDLRLNGLAPRLRLVARDAAGERVVPWRTEGPSSFVAADAGWSGAPGAGVTYVVQSDDGNGAWIDLARSRTTVPTYAATLHDAVPNPFNPATTLAFVLAADGPAQLEIYGVDGRRVRTLVHRHLTAGPHAFVWDGRDDRGRALAAGTYLVRLRTRHTVATGKAVMVK